MYTLSASIRSTFSNSEVVKLNKQPVHKRASIAATMHGGGLKLFEEEAEEGEGGEQNGHDAGSELQKSARCFLIGTERLTSQSFKSQRAVFF